MSLWQDKELLSGVFCRIHSSGDRYISGKPVLNVKSADFIILCQHVSDGSQTYENPPSPGERSLRSA